MSSLCLYGRLIRRDVVRRGGDRGAGFAEAQGRPAEKAELLRRGQVKLEEFDGAVRPASRRGSDVLVAGWVLQVERLSIPDVVLIKPRRFADDRGYFAETFSARAFRETVAGHDFVQDNEALSGSVGTVRGLHFQREPAAQGKLIRVIRGAILDVAVDIRTGSPRFGHAVSARLDAAEGAQLWVPPGFAHGYCTLEPDTLVAYKVTDFYSPTHDGGILWNDPALGIDWPLPAGGAVLSGKDAILPRLADLPPIFAYRDAEARP